MDPVIGWILLAGLGYMVRYAVEHARTDFQAKRAAAVKAAEKAAKPGKLTPAGRKSARRRHRAGWWAAEFRHGLPVTRTGLHAGWLAHQAAAAQTRIVREEARTASLETSASFHEAMTGHRERQAAARAAIEQALAGAPEPVKPTREAVRDAVGDAVILQFRQRKEVPAPADPGDGPDSARPDSAPQPGPYARRRDVRPDDSAWLKPGKPRCEACDGTGRNSDNGDACPVCLGWGSAPPLADAPPGPDGTTCSACGRPGTLADPVVADGNSWLHRSEARESRERYESVLALTRGELAPDHAAVCPLSQGDTVRNTRTGMTGQITSDDPPSAGVVHVLLPDGSAALWEHRDITATAPSTAPSTTTEGAPVMAAETTYGQVLAASRQLVARAEQDTASVSTALNKAWADADAMQAAEVDKETFAEQLELVDRLKEAQAAMARVGEQASVVESGIQRRHSGLAEAHANAPVTAADKAFYQD